MTKSTSPFFTSAPGLKRTASMVPGTRLLICADSTASMRPENSCSSVTLRDTTAATLTGGAGGAPAGAAWASLPAEQPASDKNVAAARVKARVDNIRGAGRSFIGESLWESFVLGCFWRDRRQWQDHAAMH